MADYSKFLERHARTERFGSFSEEDLQRWSKDLPAEVIDFLRAEGHASFSDGFLETVRPDDHREELAAWRLPHAKSHVFMKTAFGSYIYYRKPNYYYLEPFMGLNGNMTDQFNLVFNLYLVMDAFMVDGFFQSRYARDKASLPPLGPDEMYGLVPPLKKGGSPDGSSIDVVKARDHHAMLAKLAGAKRSRFEESARRHRAFDDGARHPPRSRTFSQPASRVSFDRRAGDTHGLGVFSSRKRPPVVCVLTT
ncbi:Hypothetical protein A7982_06239 [Minicystis rosea]|nr:Hypothetical protein A7982_06239 [Minicystis rosea]